MADFGSFLTDEEIFKLEFDKYIPDFLERLENNTLGSDAEFDERTHALIDLGRKAGIDLQEYILQYGKDNGLS